MLIRETHCQEILDVHLSFFDYLSYLLEKIMTVLEDTKLGQELEPGIFSAVHMIAAKFVSCVLFVKCTCCFSTFIYIITVFHINILKDIFTSMCVFIILQL